MHYYPLIHHFKMSMNMWRGRKRERETKTEISFEAQVFRYAIHISQFADYMYTTTQF